MGASLPEIVVRRFSTPTVRVTITTREGASITITGYAFRYTVTQDKELFPVEGTPPKEFQLFEIVPSIVAPATNGQVSIVFTLPHTSLPAGRYRGELRWRTDGVAPVTPVKPHDAESIPFSLVESVEVEP